MFVFTLVDIIGGILVLLVLPLVIILAMANNNSRKDK